MFTQMERGCCCAGCTFITESEHFIGSLFLQTGLLKIKCNYGIFVAYKRNSLIHLCVYSGAGPRTSGRLTLSICNPFVRGRCFFSCPKREVRVFVAGRSVRMEYLFSSREADALFLYEK